MGIELENKVRAFCAAWGDGSDESRPGVMLWMIRHPARPVNADGLVAIRV